MLKITRKAARKAARKFVISVTYPIWRPLVERCLFHAFHKRVISNAQLHTLSGYFDRTQKTRYRMLREVR